MSSVLFHNVTDTLLTTHKTIRKTNKMLSGKVHVTRQNGAFETQLEVEFWKISEYLRMVEDIFDQREGVLVWLTGFNEDQFSNNLVGYRNRDIYLMSPTSL